MANLRILWNNLLDVAATVFSADSAATPVSHLQLTRRTKVWRSVGRTAIITINLGATSNVRTVALTGYNLTDTATVSIAHSEDDVTYTSIATKTVGDMKTLIFFFDLLQKQYWRITITDTANVNPYVELGRLFIGNYWEPTYQLHTNWTVEIVDESTSKRSVGLQRWRNNRVPFSRISFHLPALTQSEAFQELLDILMRVGTKNDIFISLFPTGTTNQQIIGNLYGRFTNIPNVSNPAMAIYATDQLVFEENNEKD